MDVAQAIGSLPQSEPVILKAGTVVKVGGFPFTLLQDTPVEGCRSNLTLFQLPKQVG